MYGMRAESNFAVTDFNISSSSLTAEVGVLAFGTQFVEAYRFCNEKSRLMREFCTLSAFDSSDPFKLAPFFFKRDAARFPLSC
jgi:hypothetical protein